jgi:hypothetical protein
METVPRKSVNSGNNIYFPVRSNAGWFKNVETVKQLEAKLKVAAFCFDTVILENDRYELDVTSQGAFESPIYAPSLKHRVFRFNEGGEVSFSVGELDEEGNPKEMFPVVSGKALVSYHADFLPVLNPYGLTDVDCFGWISKPLSEALVEKTREVANTERDDQDFWESLPFEEFEKGYVASNYYHDMARIATGFKIPMSLDRRVTEFIRCKDARLLKIASDVMPSIYEAALFDGMPDVSQLSWGELLQIREKPVVQGFRDMIVRVRASVLHELHNLKSQKDVTLLASDFLRREIIEELSQFQPSLPNIGFNIALNLIPAYGAAVSGAMSVSDYIKKNQSWVTLFTKGRE